MRTSRFLAICVLLGSACLHAWACSCGRFPPGVHTPWEEAEWRYKGADVIFQGTAESLHVNLFRDEKGPGNLVPASFGAIRQEFTFRVSRVYKGAKATELKVVTGFGMGDCGESFDPAVRYVVYSHKEKNGELETSICSGNFEVEGSNAALRFLRGESPSPDDLEAFSQRANQELSTITHDKIRVCGSVLPREGMSSSDIHVFLLRESRFGLRVRDATDANEDGTFCLDYVEPGEYSLLAIAADDESMKAISYYPGVVDKEQARRLTVHEGDQLTRLVFGFPKKNLSSVSGRIYLRDSAVPEETFAMLVGDMRLPLFPLLHAKVQQDGSFRFPAVPSGHYDLMVVVGEDDEGDYRWLTRKVPVDVVEDVNGLEAELVPRQQRAK